MMSGGKLLLLLAALVYLARCQQKPEVSVLPKLKEIFSGDLFYLTCDNTATGSNVKWYLDDKQQSLAGQIWKIAVASAKHSGSYQCESNGQKSEKLSINVLEYSPLASLTINSGHPVMKAGHKLILQLDNDKGLQGWRCKVFRRARNEMRTIKFVLQSNEKAIFDSTIWTVPETIFWCINSTQRERSNQVIVRTSDKDVSLEMYPQPAVIGESVTLRCLVWGTDHISDTIFYKDDSILSHPATSTHIITTVTEFTQGQYKCEVNYTHKARTSGPPYHSVSDTQNMFVQEHSVKAVLYENNGLSCSCPQCSGASSYEWYYKRDAEPWEFLYFASSHMTPGSSGLYTCRAVWNNGRSFLSIPYVYKSSQTTLIIIVLVAIFTVLLLTSFAVFIKCYKRRDNTDPIYEDVELRLGGQGENKYETLHKRRGSKREAEYDTLNPGAASKESGERDNQHLKKEDIKEVEQRLGGQGENKYEALHRGPGAEREAEYDSLNPGATSKESGESDYQHLEKGEMKAAVYYTLGKDGARI